MRLLSILLLTAIAGPAVAEDAPDDIVVTATRAEQQRDTVGQAVTVIDRATIETRQNQTLSDLLATTPGVTVARVGGPGAQTSVFIRGANSGQTLVVIDGVRVNDPSTPNGAFDFGNLLIGNIDRIEVLRGPSSVPWGSQAIGGVVNIVTAPPTAEPAARLRAEYGYKDSAQLVGNLSGTFGPVAASLGGGYFRDDGISAAALGTERDGFRQYGANARVEVTLSEIAAIDLRGYFADSRNDIDGGFPVDDSDRFTDSRQLFGYAGIRFGRAGGRIKGRAAFTIADTDRDEFIAATDSRTTLARGRSERFEAQADAVLIDGLRIVAGAERERTRYRAQSQFAPQLTRARTGIDSVFAQVVATPVATVTLTGGARLDDHQTFGSETTLSASAAWRPLPGTVVRASYSEGFRAPTLDELFGPFGGNPALEPERARSYDLGVEQSLLDGAVGIGVTLFDRRTRDLIGFDPVTFSPINIDRARAEGIETFLRVRPTEALVLTANYTLTDARDRATDLRLIRRPKHSVSASLDWEARRWLNLGATVLTVSDSPDFDPATFARSSDDGYAVLGLRAAVPLSDRFEIHARVDNALDARYQVAAGYKTPGRSAFAGVRLRY